MEKQARPGHGLLMSHAELFRNIAPAFTDVNSTAGYRLFVNRMRQAISFANMDEDYRLVDSIEGQIAIVMLYLARSMHFQAVHHQNRIGQPAYNDGQIIAAAELMGVDLKQEQIDEFNEAVKRKSSDSSR